ncbi:MAG: hypothetical protein WBA28_08655 [Microbacteriaceae bacterium]
MLSPKIPENVLRVNDSGLSGIVVAVGSGVGVVSPPAHPVNTNEVVAIKAANPRSLGDLAPLPIGFKLEDFILFSTLDCLKTNISFYPLWILFLSYEVF